MLKFSPTPTSLHTHTPVPPPHTSISVMWLIVARHVLIDKSSHACIVALVHDRANPSYFELSQFKQLSGSAAIEGITRSL